MYSYVEERNKGIPVDSIFVVFPIKQEPTYEVVYSEYSVSDYNTILVNNTITVGFNKKLVYRDLVGFQSDGKRPVYKYIDLINLDILFVRDDITSSEQYSSLFPRENLEEYGLPVNIKDLAQLRGLELDSDEIKIYEAIDLFKIINKMDNDIDRDPIQLSFNEEKARRQINSLLGKTNNKVKCKK